MHLGHWGLDQSLKSPSSRAFWQGTGSLIETVPQESPWMSIDSQGIASSVQGYLLPWYNMIFLSIIILNAFLKLIKVDRKWVKSGIYYRIFSPYPAVQQKRNTLPDLILRLF